MPPTMLMASYLATPSTQDEYWSMFQRDLTPLTTAPLDLSSLGMDPAIDLASLPKSFFPGTGGDNGATPPELVTPLTSPASSAISSPIGLMPDINASSALRYNPYSRPSQANSISAESSGRLLNLDGDLISSIHQARRRVSLSLKKENPTSYV